jgi:nucleoside recognition membrane protein YjiH
MIVLKMLGATVQNFIDHVLGVFVPLLQPITFQYIYAEYFSILLGSAAVGC